MAEDSKKADKEYGFHPLRAAAPRLAPSADLPRHPRRGPNYGSQMDPEPQWTLWKEKGHLDATKQEQDDMGDWAERDAGTA